MADDDLAAIRAKRLAELEAQYGGKPQQAQKAEEDKRRQEDMKNTFLMQILEQDARARLSSIALVKPEKARAVENMLIQMAQSGQLQGKVGEAQLIALLEKISQSTQKTTVKFERRKVDSDDEDF
ncbi:hypothetical protein EMCRGX_G031879 [Ephydatia muelleri]|eukprot:Em0018g131a